MASASSAASAMVKMTLSLFFILATGMSPVQQLSGDEIPVDIFGQTGLDLKAGNLLRCLLSLVGM